MTDEKARKRCRHTRRVIPHAQKKRSPQKTTGLPTAQGWYCLWLLRFRPDPVRSQPLHRTRPSFATTVREDHMSIGWDGQVSEQGLTYPRGEAASGGEWIGWVDSKFSLHLLRSSRHRRDHPFRPVGQVGL